MYATSGNIPKQFWAFPIINGLLASFGAATTRLPSGAVQPVSSAAAPAPWPPISRGANSSRLYTPLLPKISSSPSPCLLLKLRGLDKSVLVKLYKSFCYFLFRVCEHWNKVMWRAGNSSGLRLRCWAGCAKWVRRNLITVVLRFWDYGEQTKLLPDPDLH